MATDRNGQTIATGTDYLVVGTARSIGTSETLLLQGAEGQHHVRCVNADVVSVGSVYVHVSDTAPTDLFAGRLWLDTDESLLRIYDGTDWLTASDHVLVEVRNDSGSDMSAGQAVYVASTHTSGKPQVALAENDVAGSMPAIGILPHDLANATEGFVAVSGTVKGLALDPATYSAGDALYVDSTAGGLTKTRPTATTELVQKVALVTRAHLTQGEVIVMGAGRTNDVPNEIDTDVNFASGATPSWSGTPTNAADLTTKTFVESSLSAQQTNIITYYSFGLPSRPPITCAGINASGNLTIAGTVDGRDVSTDGGNQDDLQTLTGVAAGSTNLGTFTGTTIADSETIKGALQDLETEIEDRPYVLDRQRGNPYVTQSTTTLTEYYSLTIPGGALDNKSLRIFMHGTWRNFSGASQNNQLAVYINGSSAHINANDVNNDTDKAVWRAEIELSKSATDVLFLSGQWRMSTQNTNIGGWGYLARDGVIGKDGISATTSADISVSLRQRWLTSTTNSDFQVYAITAEMV